MKITKPMIEHFMQLREYCKGNPNCDCPFYDERKMCAFNKREPDAWDIDILNRELNKRKKV